MQIALDLDGVLVDLQGSLYECHGLSRGLAWTQQTWAMAGQQGLPDTDEAVWAPVITAGREFWANCRPTRWARELVKRAGASAYIVTSPIIQDLGGCVEGKHQWVSQWFPHLQQRIVYTDDKGLTGRPGTCLVDDKPLNCQHWNAAGGRSILWPMPYNNPNWDRLHNQEALARVSHFANL